MPPPVTGKQRAARIPLDYFKHPTFLDWGRGWYALAIATLIALGWAASGWLMSGQGQTYYSRGPVTAVHATWDNDCMACHTAFTPLSGDAYAKHFVHDTHAMNQKCEACHKGPPHHADATPELACAACHHDHRGRDASLVRLADSDCTRCHADLTNHLANGTPTVDNKVTAFTAAQHPEFSVLRDKGDDPGKLKFNHARHMQEDLKLDCNSCHHLDASDRARFMVADSLRESGGGKALPGGLEETRPRSERPTLKANGRPAPITCRSTTKPTAGRVTH